MRSISARCCPQRVTAAGTSSTPAHGSGVVDLHRIDAVRPVLVDGARAHSVVRHEVQAGLVLLAVERLRLLRRIDLRPVTSGREGHHHDDDCDQQQCTDDRKRHPEADPALLLRLAGGRRNGVAGVFRRASAVGRGSGCERGRPREVMPAEGNRLGGRRGVRCRGGVDGRRRLRVVDSQYSYQLRLACGSAATCCASASVSWMPCPCRETASSREERNSSRDSAMLVMMADTGSSDNPLPNGRCRRHREECRGDRYEELLERAAHRGALVAVDRGRSDARARHDMPFTIIYFHEVRGFDLGHLGGR